MSKYKITPVYGITTKISIDRILIRDDGEIKRLKHYLVIILAVFNTLETLMMS